LGDKKKANILAFCTFMCVFGFKGNDPATDLRGVGLLGLLQPLFAVTTPELFPFAQKVFRTATATQEQEFPLLVLSINLTRIAYDALMDGLLNR
jgi:hypothetical protein